MELKYKYTENQNIRNLIREVDAFKILFETLPSRPHIEENLRRESLLKSSVFSARIEGNPLGISQAKNLELEEQDQAKSIHKKEIANLLAAYRTVYSSKNKKITVTTLKNLHKQVMHNILPDAGFIRIEPWAVFNQAGIALYLAPSPQKVQRLLQDLITVINTSKHAPPITAAIAHFLFEKIHPFADGNGRVGRLLIAAILYIHGYEFKKLVPFEELIEKNREEYYQTLEPQLDTTPFVEFFLQVLTESAKATIYKLQDHPQESPEDTLLPRRRELLEIIRDHPNCSFDFLQRRFTEINPKTLHYDIKQLQNKGFVLKLGTTRASVYKAKE
jgi:Fic family protein